MPIYYQAKYEADNGDIHPSRISEQVLQFNHLPNADINREDSITISKNKLKSGIHPRYILIKQVFLAADVFGEDRINKYKKLIVLTKIQFDLLKNQWYRREKIEYKGKIWEVVNCVPESRR